MSLTVKTCLFAETNFNEKWFSILSSKEKSVLYRTLEKIFSKENAYSTILPPRKLIFNIFNLIEFQEIKVVILGQDPYHGLNEGNGLAFSVNNGIIIPPSLRNIFNEIEKDLGIKNTSGNLESWAKQGVFLLNSILTVELHKPASHSNYGWEFFTDSIISKISENLNNVVFLLWGNFAQKKEKLINSEKHKIIKCSHPSPFSAKISFLGSKCFSRTNNFLVEKGLQPIDWKTE